MNNNAAFGRVAGVASLVILPAVVLLGVLTLAASQGSLDAGFNGSLVAGGVHSAALLRWNMLVDMFAYYLPLAPLIVLLWSRLRTLDFELAALATVSGLGYVLVGALGAALLAVVEPLLMQRYLTATAPQRDTIRVVFDVFNRGVAIALWNMLEQLLLGVWLLGTGLLLRRRRRALGLLSLAAAGFAFADGVGRIVDVPLVYDVGLVGSVLLPVFVVCCGVELLRRPATWPAASTPPLTREAAHLDPAEREA